MNNTIVTKTYPEMDRLSGASDQRAGCRVCSLGRDPDASLEPGQETRQRSHRSHDDHLKDR